MRPRISREASEAAWTLIQGNSGLRLHQFDLPMGLEEKQPFRHVAELHINENFLQPEQVNLVAVS